MRAAKEAGGIERVNLLKVLAAEERYPPAGRCRGISDQSRGGPVGCQSGDATGRRA